MCAKNSTYMYAARTGINKVSTACDLYCCLLPQLEICTDRGDYIALSQGRQSSGKTGGQQKS